jgi:hypothetical protein
MLPAMYAFGWPFRIATALMGLGFFLGMFVQYHDPAPVPRVAFYGAAAILALVSAIRTLPPRISAGLGSMAFIWAVSLAPEVLGRQQLAQALVDDRLLSPETEASRHFVGLIAIALWMGVTTARSLRRRRSIEQPQTGPVLAGEHA